MNRRKKPFSIAPCRKTELYITNHFPACFILKMKHRARFQIHGHQTQLSQAQRGPEGPGGTHPVCGSQGAGLGLRELSGFGRVGRGTRAAARPTAPRGKLDTSGQVPFRPAHPPHRHPLALLLLSELLSLNPGAEPALSGWASSHVWFLGGPTAGDNGESSLGEPRMSPGVLAGGCA